MSAAVLLDLGALDPALRLDGHLPECPHRRRPPDGCDWCLWAVEGAGVRDALDVIRDADTLTRDHDRRGGDVSVAWVVATGDLLDAHSGEQLGASTPVPSVTDGMTSSRSRLTRSVVASSWGEVVGMTVP